MSGTASRGRSACKRGWSRFGLRALLAGGPGLSVTGCAVVGGAAVAAGAAILTGFFLGRLQASFAATARSYGYTDSGNVRFTFAPLPTGRISLVHFNGRLPGFHFAVVTNRGKLPVTAQADEVLYETDVEVDFGTAPPTITGTVRERGGGEEFDLLELYPEITVSIPQIGDADAGGHREMSLSIIARGAGGEELDYRLVLDLDLSDDGDGLTAGVSVHREYRAPDEPILIILGSGDLEAEKEGEITDTPVEEENENAVSEAPIENANDNAENENAEGNENESEPPSDNASTDGVGDGGEPPANDNSDNSSDEPPTEEPIQASACIPGLSDLAASVVDAFVANGGKGALDGNGDGTVTAGEVQNAVNPILAPFFVALSDDAARCIAELVNS